MHALPPFSRRPLIAGLIALSAAIFLMLALAAEVPSIDLSLGGGGNASEPAVAAQPIPMNPELTEPGQPAWVTDPGASPLEALTGRP